MIQGVDMSTPCTSASATACLRSSGIAFVGRYYSQESWKQLTLTEAQLLCGTGLSIVSVYEDDGTSFSATLGTLDGTAAWRQANAVGQPHGTPIYFAVDYDATAGDLSTNIVPYFQAVQQVLRDVYTVGVYGSGLVCSTILGKGLAQYTWLSLSTGWSGYNMLQNPSIRQLRTISLCGFSVDTDQARGDFGAFTVPA